MQDNTYHEKHHLWKWADVYKSICCKCCMIPGYGAILSNKFDVNTWVDNDAPIYGFILCFMSAACVKYLLVKHGHLTRLKETICAYKLQASIIMVTLQLVITRTGGATMDIRLRKWQFLFFMSSWPSNHPCINQSIMLSLAHHFFCLYFRWELTAEVALIFRNSPLSC